MRFSQVCVESVGFVIPPEIVTSDQIEKELAPLYERLRLPEGRLELMTGIAERRFWNRGTLPSEKSIESCLHAIKAAGITPNEIGALIHGSVCRDHLEPATACRVHHHVGLPEACSIYDVSNACLGIMSGMVQAANMIELGQIKAALVVGTESGRNLVESTIKSLNAATQLKRNEIKSAIASLTIGSGSCAVLLTHSDLSKTHNHLRAFACRANTKWHRLCHSDKDDAVGDGMQPLMTTDSETLMREGIATGKATFESFLDSMQVSADGLDTTVSHQVGVAHRKLMLESMNLSEQNDFKTLDWLGNTGAVALPTALGCALEENFIESGDQVGLLGIGSGINSLMLGMDWQRTQVSSNFQELGVKSNQMANRASRDPSLA